MTHIKIERVRFLTPQNELLKEERRNPTPPPNFFEYLQKRSPALSALPIARLKEALMKEVRKILCGDLPAGQNEKARIDVILSREIILAAEGGLPPNGPIVTGGGGGCFTAECILLLRNGKTIRFDDLAGRIATKEEMPELASWDIEKERAVFQKPMALIEHLFEEPQQVLRLNNITVTPNHPVLAQRNQKTTFLAAGELNREDFLISPYGDKPLVVRKENINKDDQVRNLYNLSFDSKKGKQFPYFLVSHKGLEWVVAHNMNKV